MPATSRLARRRFRTRPRPECRSTRHPAKMCTWGNRDHAYGTQVSLVRHSGLLCAVANLGEGIVAFVVWPWVIDTDY